MKSVAIVGGGITGLTAAFRLRQRGVPITLYEATQRVGGVIRSIQRDGYLAEFGPNTILETSPKIASLVRDLGLESQRLYSDAKAGRRYIVRGGRPLNVPASPLAFFTSPLFSASAKCRLLREPFVPPASPDAEESVAELVLRRLGQEFLDYAINPLVAGVYAGDPARLSVKHAFPKLHALEQRYGSLIKGQILGARERRARAEVSKQTAPKVSFRGGLQDLIQALEAKLAGSLRLGAAVNRIRRGTAGWSVTTATDDRGSSADHAAVLLAGPAYQLARLEVEAGPGVDLRPLGGIVYPPVASVVLGFRRGDVAHALDGFGMLIPEVEHTSILGTIFSSSLFPNRAPDGHVTLTSYVGGARAPALAACPEDDLVARTCTDLRRILGVTGRPTFQHVVVYPKAIPQYEVGYGRFKALMTEVEGRAPGLFFAGHYREGISLGDSIVSAHDVAERIAGFVADAAEAPGAVGRGAEAAWSR
jgi:protoporphyrinogen/coproporphyrinogen III oxidase